MWPVIKDENLNMDISLYRTREISNVKNFILNGLDNTLNDIESAYLLLNKKISKGIELPIGSDWILDNFYYIKLKHQELRDNIKKENKIEISVIENGSLKGLPRAYILALDIITNLKANVTEENLINFINNFQEVDILTLEEIYHLSNFITLGLMEHIRKICLSLVNISDKWDKIDKKDLTNEIDLKKLLDNIHMMDSTEIERIIRKVKKEKENYQDILEEVDKRLEYVESNINEILEKEYNFQSKNKLSIGYGITSLRNILFLNWSKIFDEISLVEKTL